MPSQRTNATQIAPFLTHLVSHHGQLTLVPPDNNGRRRKAKQNGLFRNSPREEPVQFSGSPTVSSPSSGRPSRHTRRNSRAEEQYADSIHDIPNYPPPSFLEAMSSPPVSVCPSTTTLGLFTTPAVPRQDDDAESDSGSDDVFLNITDTGNPPRSPVPAVEQWPVQLPTPRGRGILDSDPDGSICAPPSSNSRSHRRHLSLSPLRTLFPSKNSRDSGHALSAQSTPSPHSLAFSNSSPFFRSTTSLRNLTSSMPIAPPSPSSAPSLRSESFLASRRFFSHKGKERAANEALDSWEIVESADPTTLTPPEQVIDVSTAADNPPHSPVSAAPAAIHPLSERDRLAKAKNRVPPTAPNPARERERRVPLPATAPVPLAPGEGPPIVTVRMKKPPPPPPPKKKPHPVPSPLREAGPPCALPELDLDLAIRTPLPLTPVTGSPTSTFALYTEPGSPVRERGTDSIHRIPSPAPRSSSGESDNASADVVDAEEQHHQHHYPGRPLPRRPRVPVDSTYEPHPDFPQVEVPLQPPSVPEALLIDLDAAETSTAQAPVPQPFAPVLVDLDQLTSVGADLQRNSSASSVDLAPAALHAHGQFMDMTDLDLLLARLENDHRDGANYEDLWLVSDFIGPATPVRVDHDSTSSPWHSSSAKASALLTGTIDVQRRRTTKDGRIKLKLALLGIAVDRCGICMTQFKQAERARLSERCKHPFHDHCLSRWVERSRTCPLCRVALDLDAREVGGAN